MSLFLAPIHSWLFGKIKLLQDLELSIVKSHIDKFGEEASNVQKEAQDIYGQYIDSRPLEELIDTDNIHGWLQERIKEVESRSAYIITKYHDMYKEQSKEITENEYEIQAKKCAANDENKTNTPENVYMSLNNYILSGMPCDRVNSITEKNEEVIVYHQTGCIHRANYEMGKANLDYMYHLKELWVKTFIENLDVKYNYTIEKQGDTTINKIVKG
ncbi:hypothetical protein [Asaccharospora irregularis]|uniref:Uncharacterized protein n=1 Tax=Asaccharospora irregularis DSM 2635 TaxID=1121321 RepID=A0A1M5J7P7_9FIRM|nr:hypothetical protein [Asaccharospora irregularis]SHG36270.1 hypothetical protein SAMN04488530_10117 [Asaccharospora irregularis DSM 2635]